MELEDLFHSKGRMKILKLLFRLGQLNTSDLALKVRSNYATTLKNLVLLEKEELVEHCASGRIRFFRLTDSVKAQAIKRLLEAWETQCAVRQKMGRNASK